MKAMFPEWDPAQNVVCTMQATPMEAAESPDWASGSDAREKNACGLHASPGLGGSPGQSNRTHIYIKDGEPFPARKPDERKRGRSSFRAGWRRGVYLALTDGDLATRNQGRGADGLQRGDGLGHERCLLFDDGVIDGSAEAFVEDFDAEEFGTGGGAVFVGGGDGDIKGQDLISEPGESGLFELLHRRQRDVVEYGRVGGGARPTFS